MTYEIVKGSLDSSPNRQIKINYILDIIKKNFEKYGFRPFDTPIIEYFETLCGKYEKDDEILNEIYKLSDRGNRKLGLRYDLTVPLCRYVAGKKQLKLPFKRYAIGKVFRDGPIKAGRLREFIQCDGDIIGIGGAEVEAEILNLFYKTYLELKIEAIIEINNNKILKGAFLQAGFKEQDLSKLILSVDKLKKIGKEKVLKEIESKGLEIKNAKKAIKILESTNIDEITKKAKNKILKEGIKELLELKKILDYLVINYKINFSLSRGLDIYSGNIWEAYDLNQNITSSIGSGGRYDEIISQFSDDKINLEALGISFGLIPILECLKIKNKHSNTDILIVPLKKKLVLNCFDIAKKLRKDKNVEISYSYRLSKGFDYANYIGAKEIIFFGDVDLENENYKIKNLETGEEIIKKL